MTETSPAQRDASCFLCAATQLPVGETFREENLLVDQTPNSIVILNKFPYSSGHTLISPKRHISQLEDLNPAESMEIMQLLQKTTTALKKALRPDGFNVGINLGQIAGAGVPGHLHIHIVPRWNGDHNFMPVTGHTRVMPMLMDDIWKRIRENWPETPSTV